jgi:hypothetical protein
MRIEKMGGGTDVAEVKWGVFRPRFGQIKDTPKLLDAQHPV